MKTKVIVMCVLAAVLAIGSTAQATPIVVSVTGTATGSNLGYTAMRPFSSSTKDLEI